MAIQLGGQVQGLVPPISQKTGQGAVFNQGFNYEMLVSEIWPRFSALTKSNLVFSQGMALTSISNATFTVADAGSGTLGTAAATTPVLGLWNPITSTAEAHILLAQLSITTTALAASGCGGFTYFVYTGQTAAITTAVTQGVNRRTFLTTSQAKFIPGVALTGLVNTGVVLGASSLNGGSAINTSETQTAAGFLTQVVPSVEILDGSIIVQPGTIVALACQSTPVAMSAVSGLVWAELPI